MTPPLRGVRPNDVAGLPERTPSWSVGLSRPGMGLHPKVLGGLQGIDPEVFPPGLLIARLMQLSMVTAAERHGEFSLT